MTTNHVRRYDVAISFLAEDERVAMSLATALKKHWTVFIYTERQKELAGTDGVEAFSRVFKEDCWLWLADPYRSNDIHKPCNTTQEGGSAKGRCGIPSLFAERSGSCARSTDATC